MVDEYLITDIRLRNGTVRVELSSPTHGGRVVEIYIGDRNRAVGRKARLQLLELLTSLGYVLRLEELEEAKLKRIFGEIRVSEQFVFLETVDDGSYLSSFKWRPELSVGKIQERIAHNAAVKRARTSILDEDTELHRFYFDDGQ